MGLDSNGIKFLLYTKSLGVDFLETATIGRQYLYIEPSGFKDILSSFNYQVDDKNLEIIFKENDGYAETFFRYIGADITDSFDYSNYEGATHIHDMNLAIPDIYKDKYNVVIDGGALEHIFNFPVAIKNCMEMIKVGGYYLGITPGNNFMGHGFYQFSPELLFRIFTKENGYEVVKLIVFETSSPQWFSVQDPYELKERVTLENQFPLYILVIAKKVSSVEIFKNTPQQSDYSLIWNEKPLSGLASISATKKQNQNMLYHLIRRITPRYIKSKFKNIINNSQDIFNPRFFTPFDTID
ncbi:hypothetical protein NIES2107_53560 [Nostoc carneum NIES-2107]|nr:hypothetical protein NIES2107_53560 [Nostoc carneum NIES-2107]